MYAIQPLTMQLQTVQPCCIIDVPLALGRYGLAATMLLARVARVWLSPTVWAIVDDPGFYLADDRLVGRLCERDTAPVDEAARARVRATLAHWRRARDDYGLDVREGIFWPADKLGEAVVPKGCDGSILARLDALAVGLDRRRQESGNGAVSGGDVDVLADCARDTLALAAALADERPIVLTTRPAAITPPDLSLYLADSHIRCQRLDDLSAMRLLRGALAPVLVHAGLVDLAASGALRLAALSLIAPAAALPPPQALLLDDDDGELRWNSERGGEMALWDDATAVWYDLP
jgi:hypothetical protein